MLVWKFLLLNVTGRLTVVFLLLHSIMAEVVFHNGNFITFDSDNSRCTYIAVKDGKIIARGNGDDYKSQVNEGTTVHDLGGKNVLPGFVESHNHFNAVANQWGWTDVGITQCSTIDEVLNKIKNARDEQTKVSIKEGEALPWIKCVGFDDTLISELRNITKSEIDSVCSDYPVWIWHPSLHRAYVNSKAFEIAGITEEVQDPQGGCFVRDENGKLTGQMEEMIAFQLVYVHLNKTIDPRSKVRDMWAAAKYFASKGVTTVHDLFVGELLFKLYAGAFSVSILLLRNKKIIKFNEKTKASYKRKSFPN